MGEEAGEQAGGEAGEQAGGEAGEEAGEQAGGEAGEDAGEEAVEQATLMAIPGTCTYKSMYERHMGLVQHLASFTLSSISLFACHNALYLITYNYYQTHQHNKTLNHLSLQH